MGRCFSLSSVFFLSFSLAVASAAATATTAEASPGSVGIMVDAGVPDGFNGSLVFRPIRFFQLHAGGGTNLISYGVRAGASLYLLPTWISPSINAEAGRYFPGDANAAVMRLGIASDADSPVLREVGYDYANLHLGLDVGRDRCSFFIHAGFSTLHGKLRNLDELVQEEASGGLMVNIPKDATVNLVFPSARIGFLFFF